METVIYGFWKKIANKLHNSLIWNQYDEAEWLTPQAVNYRKVKIEYKKLLNKFNFKLDSSI